VRRRAVLRVILGAYLGVAPSAVTYTVNEFGKPAVIASATCCGLSFNASHSEGVALIAIGRSVRVGVDIERLRPVAEAESIAGRFFARNEAAALLCLPPRDRVQGFYNAWTRKEALVKALGSGLSTPLDAFEVSVRPGEAAAIVRMDIVGEAAQGWRLHHMEPAVGFVGALAVDRDSTVCQYLWRNNRA
jgi:4'-phosphopantetheinyl transferase